MFYASNCNNVNVTVIVVVLPLLFVTAQYMLVDGVASLLYPIAAGLIKIVSAVVVITSAITPEPGVGSAPSARDESALLAAVLT